MELAVAIFALVVSILTFLDTRKSNRASLRLTEQEIELLRHQLSRIRSETLEERKANITAQMFRDGKNWRVRVVNLGPAEARNVRLVLDDSNQMVVENALSGKFPMERMDRDQSVDFWARVHIGSPLKETLVIRWDDQSGIEQEKKVELTV